MNHNNKTYKVIGLMSGTSLDGLDIAYCEFELRNGTWIWEIREAQTIEYDSTTRQRIIDCEICDAQTFAYNNVWLGHLFGKMTADFIKRHSIEPDFISSHGQTIFHQPYRLFTSQIADLNAISAETKCSVIGNFRSLDVALGGQGAPLVPIGDRLLFSQYPYCVNLGGFANVSFEQNGKRIAYDVCPVNLVLNSLAQSIDLKYDNQGTMASEGSVNQSLLDNLNALPFYNDAKAKSLGKEWVIENIFPLFDKYKLSIKDTLSTFCEHIAMQISANIKSHTLITGGGAYNTYLLSRIKALTPYQITIPNRTIIDYKEALIFAFLGVLRYEEQINVLSSVTGACRDSCSGEIVCFLK
ncbi:MAG: anhydro-N-acetylmuramic acid kinase [Bacteroidales bacterium]|jgi:anhydro-N-acetylmuramic acid kinase|nr:anhydro-N-acetylmuramic acid kinase [Bacteroidales bacterium]